MAVQVVMRRQQNQIRGGRGLLNIFDALAQKRQVIALGFPDMGKLGIDRKSIGVTVNRG